MKKNYVTPEVECINFYSEETIAEGYDIGNASQPVPDGDDSYWD